MLCAFCHAPEHAHDQSNEDPEISRDGMCADAPERLRMAATPKPGYHHGGRIRPCLPLDERAHAWEVVRDIGLGRVCGCQTWKYPQDSAPSCCARRTFGEPGLGDLGAQALACLETVELTEDLETDSHKLAVALEGAKLLHSSFGALATLSFVTLVALSTLSRDRFGVDFIVQPVFLIAALLFLAAAVFAVERMYVIALELRRGQLVLRRTPDPTRKWQIGAFTVRHMLALTCYVGGLLVAIPALIF